MPTVHSKLSDTEESSGVLRSNTDNVNLDDTMEDAVDEFDQDEEIEDDKIEQQTYLSYEPYKFFETFEEACACYFFEINNKKIK